MRRAGHRCIRTNGSYLIVSLAAAESLYFVAITPGLECEGRRACASVCMSVHARNSNTIAPIDILAVPSNMIRILNRI